MKVVLVATHRGGPQYRAWLRDLVARLASKHTVIWVNPAALGLFRKEGCQIVGRWRGWRKRFTELNRCDRVLYVFGGSAKDQRMVYEHACHHPGWVVDFQGQGVAAVRSWQGGDPAAATWIRRAEDLFQAEEDAALRGFLNFRAHASLRVGDRGEIALGDWGRLLSWLEHEPDSWLRPALSRWGMRMAARIEKDFDDPSATAYFEDRLARELDEIFDSPAE